MQRLMTIALCVSLAAPLVAASPDPSTEGNIRVQLTLVETTASGEVREHPIETLLATGGRARVALGWKIPIPSALTVAAGATQPSGPIHYQDVGLSVRLDASVPEPGKFQVGGDIEMSHIDPTELTGRPGAPKVDTFSHIFNVLLVEGEARQLVRVPGPQGGATSLQIVAHFDG